VAAGLERKNFFSTLPLDSTRTTVAFPLKKNASISRWLSDAHSPVRNPSFSTLCPSTGYLSQSELESLKTTDTSVHPPPSVFISQYSG